MTKKTIPSFRNEDDEREFWAQADSTEYIDWSKSSRVTFPNLKPSTRTISLRLPESVIDAMKLLANGRDVPYQSLMKVFLVERIASELSSPIQRKNRPRKKVRRTRKPRRASVKAR